MELMKYRLDSIEESGEIQVFTFSPLNGKKLEFKAGQFVMIYINEVKRAYSLASAPGLSTIRFGIKMIGGAFTGLLAKLKKGDQVSIAGPYGHFAYGSQSKCIFIAGGSGITPFISMLDYVILNKIPGDFYLFYSTKNRKAICFSELLRKYSKYKNIHVLITLTKEQSEGYESSRITSEMISKHVANPGEYSWYICGPLAMIRDMKDIAKSFDAKEIKIEGWG